VSGVETARESNRETGQESGDSAADGVYGRAGLLAVRLGEEYYAITAKSDWQQDHVLVVDPPARRVAGRADNRDGAVSARWSGPAAEAT
jgi:hypothetical protein